MPAAPSWTSRLPEILGTLAGMGQQLINRPAVEKLLNVRPRRASQILQICQTQKIGASALTDAATLLAWLRHQQEKDETQFEVRRRSSLASQLEGMRKERAAALLVEAPTTVVLTEFESLPAGVNVEPGRVSVEFESPNEGLRKLLALAMAIRNDEQGWERRAGK